MNRLAGVVFAVLAVATFGAFFAAQRLKHNPPAVQSFHRTPAVFSPNNDGRLDNERVTFAVKKADDVTVDIVDHSGEPIRRLVSNRHAAAYRKIGPLRWDGRTDAGKMAPDGVYRARVILRSQDRSVIVPKSFLLDTTPPQPKVQNVGTPGKLGPQVLPVGNAGTVIDAFAPGHHRVITIYRTDVDPAIVVRTIAIPDGAAPKIRVPWDGRDAQGRPVPAGIYLAGIQARDQAGNRGAVPKLRRDGVPANPYGLHVAGNGGITVSDLSVLPPLVPRQAGQATRFLVAAQNRPYRWSVRRLGLEQPLRSGGGRGVGLTIPAPRGSSGVYLLKVHSNRTTLRVPFAVNGQPSVAGTPDAPGGVLVVLPALSWQGHNPVDTDGDGEPDTLDHGVAVGLLRGFSGDGLPVKFAHGEANALLGLDHRHRRYDITTDFALAAGVGPALDDYHGVLLAGDEHWITAELGRKLRTFVRRGGTLVSLGTDSLMRQVSLSSSNRLARPTARAKTDIFGARILPLVNRPVTLTNLKGANSALFTGTVGQFTGYRRYEPTASLGTQMSLAADAVDEIGRPVIVAAHYGRGLVVRVGLPDFAASLVDSPQTSHLYDRIWTVLSR